MMAIAALTAYTITEAHYGLRLSYMYPTNGKDGNNLVEGGDASKSMVTLLNSMFGTTGDMMIPDISRTQGSFLQLEGVNFNVEENASVPMQQAKIPKLLAKRTLELRSRKKQRIQQKW